MDPQRQFTKHNRKITEHMRFRTSFLRFNESVTMKDFEKPIKCLIIYTGYKYETFLCQNTFLFRNNHMENLGGPQIKTIDVNILAFLNICDKN